MINIPDDIPKYRKKSSRHPPKNSKHKHEHKECLLKIKMAIKYSTGESIVDTLYLGKYCTICGKIGGLKLPTIRDVFDGVPTYRVMTNDEILEKYKHLETFEIDDVYDKYVTLSNVVN